MRILKLLLVLIFINSCTTGSNAPENKYSLNFSDTLEIDFSNQLFFDLGFPAFYNYNDTLVYYMTNKDQSVGLETFHLEKMNWLDTKYFPLEGPNQWYNFYGGLQIIDSTTALHPLTFGFQLVDLNDSTTLDIFFKDEINVSSNNYNPQEQYFRAADSVVGFPITPYIRTDEPDYTSKTSVYGLFSISDRNWLSKIPMAEEFHGNIYSTNWLKQNFMVKGDTIFVNYAKSHTIYGYNTEGKLIIEKPIKSDKVQVGYQPLAEDKIMNMILFEKGGQYTNFFYSKKHKLYFRFFSYFSTPPESNTLEALISVTDSFQRGIIIADENFEIKAVETLPISEYEITPNMHFFKDGELYIWLMNDTEDKKYYVSVIPVPIIAAE